MMFIKIIINIFYDTNVYTSSIILVDLGDGLSFVTTFMPQECKYQAETDDIIHYHYVGRLSHNGQVFGQRYFKNINLKILLQNLSIYIYTLHYCFVMHHLG